MEFFAKIEQQLKGDPEFDIRQTFGHPFIDFRISFVGSTFESLINEQNGIPSLTCLYKKFKMNYFNQFVDQKLKEKYIYGRVARMWASLVREWHAFYLLVYISKPYDFDVTNIVRNDRLDTYSGVDIYLKNPKNINLSIKLDILQSTARANYFRRKKDTFRLKDGDIPGVKYKIYLGDNNKDATKIVNNWYLMREEYASRIIKYYDKQCQ
jgi:hypothetical protein